jgi:hypothetical protein
VTREHGRVERPELAPLVVATIHPSAVLRSRDATEREDKLAGMVADLRLLAEVPREAARPALEQPA